ncbi:fumarylacetoacetate hydrolase family protein [Amycolatopsis pithecellobii]|uniref:Fumarylacetoacetate hydrolase n=1 Tax=Amycolatopsis pithecellobii TaxID=664692 RepID=A0A6N7Z6P9_9PSEU|nr:fumarylacetoacetate hydrolase family protein [Amycolatopsis pithecellobii]MTD57639.1 fumarylacetoacetate hydrolase [Amycolatopsis pithecellobii]
MRLATRAGRAVLVSSDGTTTLDVAKVGDGAFGPDARGLYERWDEFLGWATVAGDREGDALSFEELGPPSPDPRQVFAIGLNYRDHAEESGLEPPVSPATFTKFVGSFAGPVGELVLPAETVDWEAELVVVVGRRADKVAAAEAWSYVAGLTVGQDYSERALQLTGSPAQFSLGKSFPGFAPQGPWLVTPDELPDPDRLRITCTVNGETVQDSSTGNLIFSVPELIARLSAVLPLLPGDVVFAGTPAGIGGTRTPPRFLRPGDVVETTVEGIGRLRQRCVGF